MLYFINYYQKLKKKGKGMVQIKCGKNYYQAMVVKISKFREKILFSANIKYKISRGILLP